MKRQIRFQAPVGIARYFWDAAIRDFHEPPDDIITLGQYVLQLAKRTTRAEAYFDAATWGPGAENVRFCLKTSRADTGRLVVVFCIGNSPLQHRAYQDHAVISEGHINLTDAKEALRWGATALSTRARFPAVPQGQRHGLTRPPLQAPKPARQPP